jgi:hypothetical protein
MQQRTWRLLRLKVHISKELRNPAACLQLLTSVSMWNRIALVLTFFFSLQHGCSDSALEPPVQLKYRSTGSSPQVIALYEAWFGHPRHVSVGYSSQDPDVLNRQIKSAKAMGISAFVVDWYGDREPFIDRSYSEMQKAAAKNDFRVAMMYDETDHEEDATDVAIADFTSFHEAYLSNKSPGHEAYLTYQGRPLIFVFPKSGHTNWNKVRALVNTWNPVPLLIQENLPGEYANAFDGFYAWVSPVQGGDGSNWGEQYLTNFYETMKTKYPDKMIVGGAWSTFDDSKASWGLNRKISARCGQTFHDTFNFWRSEFPPGQIPPFIMLETWNDYEEGTALERGIPNCGDKEDVLKTASQAGTSAPAAQ